MMASTKGSGPALANPFPPIKDQPRVVLFLFHSTSGGVDTLAINITGVGVGHAYPNPPACY